MGRTKATIQTEKENVSEQPIIKEAKSERVPKYVDDILKMHPELKEVYISKYGGAFAPETPEIIRGNAQLYTNPYYNKK